MEEKLQDLVDIINQLEIDDAEKNDLLARAKAGYTDSLVADVKAIIDREVHQLRSENPEAAAELDSILSEANQELDKAYGDFEQEMAGIAQDADKAEQAFDVEADELAADQIRQSIGLTPQE
jgi:ElaB/YqjD/DUF883 family membrane-anchored ribosome-binding protein